MTQQDFDIEEIARPDGVIPINLETTAALVREIVRLKAEVRRLTDLSNSVVHQSGNLMWRDFPGRS